MKSYFLLYKYLWLIVLAGLLVACSGEPTATPEPTPEPRDDTAIRTALSEGVHGDTYDRPEYLLCGL
jgi:hypothetical protein